ncbi:hypothetical protein TNCV_1370551 [Trichonephila clavipes]|nr:hypothetical protein TNCV_1370551 [Trichonephila clavipes]
MGKGAISSRRLDFYLLVHGRYFISLLPPIGNQWRRSPIRHLGTRPLGVTFTNLCHEVEEVISSCKRKKWTEFCETLDPQKISQHWKVIKTLNNQSTHQKADIPTNIISSSGRDAATNKETASLLAKHYENKSKLTFNANDRKLLRTYRKTIQDSKDITIKTSSPYHS